MAVVLLFFVSITPCNKALLRRSVTLTMFFLVCSIVKSIQEEKKYGNYILLQNSNKKVLKVFELRGLWFFAIHKHSRRFITPLYTTLFHTTPHHTPSHHITSHHTTPHYTTPHHTTPHHTPLHHTTPQHATPHPTTQAWLI